MRADLPHRAPFVLVDDIVERAPGERVSASRLITTADPLVRDQDGLGEMLLVEAMAQCAGVAASRDDDEPAGVLVAIDNFQSRARIVPGDRLGIDARVVKRMGAMARIHVTVHVGEELRAEGHLTLRMGPPPDELS